MSTLTWLHAQPLGRQSVEVWHHCLLWESHTTTRYFVVMIAWKLHISETRGGNFNFVFPSR